MLQLEIYYLIAITETWGEPRNWNTLIECLRHLEEIRRARGWGICLLCKELQGLQRAASKKQP